MGLTRSLVLGNSGSGKSWLSEQIAKITASKAIDLDAIHWEPDGYNVPRDKDLAVALVRRAAAGEAWVIEGVYGWLMREATSRATSLIWLDIPVADCLDNLKQRGVRRGGDEASFAELLAWTADYSHRQTSSSLVGHEKIFSNFHGQKVRLFSRSDIRDFLAVANLAENSAET